MEEYQAMKRSEMYQGCRDFPKIEAAYVISEATSNMWIVWHKCLDTSFVHKHFLHI
jgi:hypothetical protein